MSLAASPVPLSALADAAIGAWLRGRPVASVSRFPYCEGGEGDGPQCVALGGVTFRSQRPTHHAHRRYCSNAPRQVSTLQL